MGDVGGDANGRWFTGWRLFLAFAAVKLLVHLAVGEGYGYFRDEFYYLACADHLDWGYVDHPPLSIVALAGWRAIFGETVVAIRLLPALAGAATVFAAGWLTRAIGGGRFAQVLAMTSTLTAPYYLGVAGVVSMNSLDILFWTAAAIVLVGILRTPASAVDAPSNRRRWLSLGVVLGLGLMNKISVLWLGLGLFVGLLLTAHRRRLRSPWPWLSGALALALFSPYVIWNAVHGWPTLEFIERATTLKMATISLLDFLGAQVQLLNPLSLPIWLAGLVWLLLLPDGRSFRPLGIAFVTVLAVLLLMGSSRPGYLAPAYTILLAAGGVALEGWLARLSPRISRPLQAGAVVLLLTGGAILAPLALPILPVETYIDYAATLDVEPSTDERKQVAALPQHFADMFGWEGLVSTVAEVYEALPEEDRAVATVFAQNYGQAGAVDLLGEPLALPKAISGHNNYWLWGPRGYSGEIVIVIDGDPEEMATLFEEVEAAAVRECRYCMPYEADLPIYVGRGLIPPLEEIWPRLKHFD